jgi:hypothetical protein
MSEPRSYDLVPPRPLQRAERPAAGNAASTERVPGEALPGTIRQQLEPRLGADFSSVRIHTDAQSGASARALGARAFSVGDDIVFAPGQFAPDTTAGRELIAHELYHVKQDGARRPEPGGPMMIDAPDSPQERQAELAARSAVGPGESVSPAIAHRAAVSSSHGGPVVHRTVAAGVGGAVVGGIIGAVIPAAIFGALLGPVAGVLLGIGGAIGGAVAGYFIGDSASTTRRGLTATEKTYLREIFHDSVDLDRIQIARGAALGSDTARTTGNTVNLPDRYFVGDTLDLTPQGMLTLCHETGHVWQYQHGGLDYIPSALIPQAVAGASGSRNAAYNWRNAVDNNLPWHRWNAEQQAQCISDYNEALRRINADSYGPEDPQRVVDFHTITLAEPYIELVREGIGAPGSARRERESPGAAPAGATP